MQVCAANLLSTDRDAVEALVVANLRFALGRTTAVYLVRESTTAGGVVCWTFVYQGPSPLAAARAGQSIADAQPPGTPPDTLVVVDSQGDAIACALTVVPWQGESPPLPVLPDLSAQDLLFYGGVAGGVLGVCFLATCCFVALSYSQDERHAQDVLRADRRFIRKALRARDDTPA